MITDFCNLTLFLPIIKTCFPDNMFSMIDATNIYVFLQLHYQFGYFLFYFVVTPKAKFTNLLSQDLFAGHNCIESPEYLLSFFSRKVQTVQVTQCCRQTWHSAIQTAHLRPMVTRAKARPGCSAVTEESSAPSGGKNRGEVSHSFVLLYFF